MHLEDFCLFNFSCPGTINCKMSGHSYGPDRESGFSCSNYCIYENIFWVQKDSTITYWQSHKFEKKFPKYLEKLRTCEVGGACSPRCLLKRGGTFLVGTNTWFSLFQNKVCLKVQYMPPNRATFQIVSVFW